METAPQLRAVSPEATPEEVAAIVAALTELARRRRAAEAPAHSPAERAAGAWVTAARLRARRASLQRGPWRLSGRLPRRPR